MCRASIVVWKGPRPLKLLVVSEGNTKTLSEIYREVELEVIEGQEIALVELFTYLIAWILLDA